MDNCVKDRLYLILQLTHQAITSMTLSSGHYFFLYTVLVGKAQDHLKKWHYRGSKNIIKSMIKKTPVRKKEISWGWAVPSLAANWDFVELWLTFVVLYWLIWLVLLYLLSRPKKNWGTFLSFSFRDLEVATRVKTSCG